MSQQLFQRGVMTSDDHSEKRYKKRLKGRQKKRRILFKRGVMTPDEPGDKRRWTYKEWFKGRQTRLEKYYPKQLIPFIYRLQRMWELYPSKTSFEELYEMLKPTVEYEANRNGRKWANKRLSSHDFESVFWETTWRVIVDIYYDCDEEEFTLFETLKLYYKSRALDVVRKATQTKQGKLEHEALSLQDWDRESVDIADDVTDRVYVEVMINDAVLTDEEQKFLCIIYADPGASLTDLARQLEYSHHEQIKRLKARIAKKLEAYNPYPLNVKSASTRAVKAGEPVAETTLEEQDRILDEELLMDDELTFNLDLDPQYITADYPVTTEPWYYDGDEEEWDEEDDMTLPHPRIRR